MVLDKRSWKLYKNQIGLQSNIHPHMFQLLFSLNAGCQPLISSLSLRTCRMSFALWCSNGVNISSYLRGSENCVEFTPILRIGVLNSYPLVWSIWHIGWSYSSVLKATRTYGNEFRGILRWGIESRARDLLSSLFSCQILEIVCIELTSHLLDTKPNTTTFKTDLKTLHLSDLL